MKRTCIACQWYRDGECKNIEIQEYIEIEHSCSIPWHPDDLREGVSSRFCPPPNFWCNIGVPGDPENPEPEICTECKHYNTMRYCNGGPNDYIRYTCHDCRETEKTPQPNSELATDAGFRPDVCFGCFFFEREERK